MHLVSSSSHPVSIQSACLFTLFSFFESGGKAGGIGEFFIRGTTIFVIKRNAASSSPPPPPLPFFLDKNLQGTICLYDEWFKMSCSMYISDSLCCTWSAPLQNE